MKEVIEISTNINRLDINFIHTFITETYWAKGRTIETMQTCIDNSLNFGVYLQKKQIGYGRIVTDYGHFAYLMDLFIDSQHRGKGLSIQLMKFILNFDALNRIKVWRLATSDAHGLYEKFGFKLLLHPENLMELNK